MAGKPNQLDDPLDDPIDDLEENKRNPVVIIGAIVAVILVLIAIGLQFFVGGSKKNNPNNSTKVPSAAQNDSPQQNANQHPEATIEPIQAPSYVSTDSVVMNSANTYATKWQKDAMPWVIVYSVLYDSNGKIDPNTTVVGLTYLSKNLPNKSFRIVLDQNGNFSNTDPDGETVKENPEISDMPPQLAAFTSYVNLSDLKIDLPQALSIGEGFVRKNHPEAVYANGACIISLSYLKDTNNYFWSYTSYSGKDGVNIDHVYINAITGEASRELSNQ